MPAAYERWLEPAVFGPFADDLARRVLALGPRRVLELAAGTGAVTRRLVDQGAEVVATDLNEAMVERGRAVVPLATWQPADASALSDDLGQFDAIVCQFGVMFFSDKVAAHRQVAARLGPGGRYLFNVWGPVETHGFAVALTEALVEVVGQAPPFISAVPHSYFDRARIESDLNDGGLVIREIDEVVLRGSSPSAGDIARGFCLGTPVRTAAPGAGMSEGDLADAVAGAMERRVGPGPMEADMTALVVDASAG